MYKPVKVVLINLLLLLILLATLEVFLFITMRVPSVHKVLPNFITKISRRIYFPYDMKMIQFLPETGRFDSSLGYTLKPGKFNFSNSEFTNEYSVNSLGVRDSEAALASPQVIVLGDSYAMGWGVNQNETFAKLIEAKTGLTVLNAAVSSYGTAREMMLLKKIKRDRLKYLIIQYCENDHDENLEFLKNGNKLITMSREKYERESQGHQTQMKYYFGKFLLAAKEIIKNDYQRIFRIGDFKKVEKEAHQRPKDEAGVFLEVILNSGIDLSGVQLVVFNVYLTQNTFVTSLREKISSANFPPFIKNMIILDVTKFLTDDHLFVLDSHFNQRGHQAVADMILRHIVLH